jgi:23S rRNA U2552 (ribose-2'-O)-methylase RlmE/FtsJ
VTTRVKTAKGRKVGSTKWLQRQLNDPYVKKAKAEGYRSRAAYKLLELGGDADLVLSDMAANTVGHPQTDHLRTMGLVELGLEFAKDVLKPGGAYVAKVLAGGTDHALLAELKRHFATVKHAKPPASRKDSSEWYVVAQGFKGRAEGQG